MMKSIRVIALLLATATGAVAADGIQSIAQCRIIDRSGSYVLAHNITADARDLTPFRGDISACILITADFVTLDLAGYTVFAPPRGAGATIGIQGLSRGVTVRDGAVTGFDVGIQVEGAGSVVQQTRAIGNLQEGITAGPNVRIVQNVASNNARAGISAICPSLVLQNLASGQSSNFQIIGAGCTVADNNPQP